MINTHNNNIEKQTKAIIQNILRQHLAKKILLLTPLLTNLFHLSKFEVLPSLQGSFKIYLFPLLLIIYLERSIPLVIVPSYQVIIIPFSLFTLLQLFLNLFQLPSSSKIVHNIWTQNINLSMTLAQLNFLLRIQIFFYFLFKHMISDNSSQKHFIFGQLLIFPLSWFCK